MPAIVTDKFRIQNAKNFISPAVPNVYYAFIGKPTLWSNEQIPDTPIDSVKDELAIWDDMIAMKKITSSNASHVIKNRVWTTGVYYDIYRHDYGHSGVNGITLAGQVPNPVYRSLSDANFYVVAGVNQIYLCISNNSGQPSTVDPSTLTYDSHKIGTNITDNYVWKYIGLAATTEVTKFSTSDWHPILTLATDPITGPYVPQWENQVASVTDAGAIFNTVLTAGGTGYGANLTNSAAIATVVGDGTGATAVVNTNGAGKITKISMSNYGTGYTWAKITFITGTGAAATPIITPAKGLGADPVQDLLAFATCTNVRFEYDEGQDFPVTNDFRRFGIVLNPTEFSSSNILSAVTVSAMTLLKVTPVSGSWVVDAVVEDSTSHARGVIVDIQDGTGGDVGKKLIWVIRTEVENSATGADATAAFVATHTLTILGGGTASGTISSVVDAEVQPNSGNIIYIENRRPVSRSIDQIEDLKFVIEF